MKFPWYDSDWLHIYDRARLFIAEVEPSSLAVFEEAFKLLSPPAGFNTRELNQFFDASQLEELRTLIAVLKERELEDHELFDFGRFVLHDNERFNQLQLQLTDTVTQLCGEEVKPSYNFLSLYNNLGVCRPHMDSPLAKWTLDVCLDQSYPWPIYLSDPTDFPKSEHITENWQDDLLENTAFHRYTTEPGDALLFAGSHQWHYRERIPQVQQQNYCHLIFFHFTPVATQDLLNPRRWPDRLQLPVLTELSDEFEAFFETGEWASTQAFEQP